MKKDRDWAPSVGDKAAQEARDIEDGRKILMAANTGDRVVFWSALMLRQFSARQKADVLGILIDRTPGVEIRGGIIATTKGEQ